jgi:hypothetical protein
VPGRRGIGRDQAVEYLCEGPQVASQGQPGRVRCACRMQDRRDLYDLLDYEAYGAFDTGIYNFRV